MKIGAVLASLKKDQYIEIIGSEYDKKTGRPIGGGFPVIIGFDPAIQKAAAE